MHDIQILEPMARSSVYDFAKEDVEKMFSAMQETLDSAKAEYDKKFEEKVKAEKRTFAFDDFSSITSNNDENVLGEISNSSEEIL